MKAYGAIGYSFMYMFGGFFCVCWMHGQKESRQKIHDLQSCLMVNLGDKDRDMSTCTYIMIRLNMQALITCRLYWVMLGAPVLSSIWFHATWLW